MANNKVRIMFGDYAFKNSEGLIRIKVEDKGHIDAISKLSVLLNKNIIDKEKSYIFYNIDLLKKDKKGYPILRFIEEYYNIIKEKDVTIVDYKNFYIPFQYQKYFKINFGLNVRKSTYKEAIYYVLSEPNRENVFNYLKESTLNIRYIVKVIALSIQSNNNRDKYNKIIKSCDRYFHKIKEEILIGIMAFGFDNIGKIPLIFPELKEKNKKSNSITKAKKITDINILKLEENVQKAQTKNIRKVI